MSTGEITDESLFKKIDIILDAKMIKRSEKIRRLIELIFRIGGIVTATTALLILLSGGSHSIVLMFLCLSALFSSASLLPKK